MASQTDSNRTGLITPAFLTGLTADVRLAWFWLIVRLYVGWQWLSAGWGKVTDSTWVGSQAGTALSGFLSHAISLTSGAHPTVQAWYAWFLQHLILPGAAVWSYVVAFGELFVGIALLLGLLTGLAAFFGGFMNFNYLMAGSVSTNPYLLVFEFGLVAAWKIAGWWGVDRWLLPRLGLRRQAKG
jgi:thiosulfate dehydrogenase [quinone] large subunit